MKIGVIDYGASNIFSVVRALNSLGASTKILKKSKDFENIDKLVFPGQGSMGACLKKLSEISGTFGEAPGLDERAELLSFKNANMGGV